MPTRPPTASVYQYWRNHPHQTHQKGNRHARNCNHGPHVASIVSRESYAQGDIPAAKRRENIAHGVSRGNASKSREQALKRAEENLRRKTESLVPRGFHGIFTVKNHRRMPVSIPTSAGNFGAKACPARLLARIVLPACTKTGHVPVNGLHSIEKPILTKRNF